INQIFVHQKRKIKTKKTKLNIYYQNTRGLRTKLKHFLTSSACCSSDIICISETWLNDSISSGEVTDNTFTLFRKDRNKLSSERSGGLLIAVKKYLAAELIEHSEDAIEQLFIKVKCTNSDPIVGCTYLPPLSPLDSYISHTNTVSFLKYKYPNCKLLSVGDFNLPSSYPQALCENVLYNEMSLVNCQQFNSNYNSNKKILDLCFSDTNVIVSRADPLINEDYHHPALEIHADIQANLKKNTSLRLIFNEADYIGLNEFFMSSNWIELYQITALDVKITWFYEKLNEVIELYVPTRYKKSNNYPTWFSNELIYKIKKKKQHTLDIKKLNLVITTTFFADFGVSVKTLMKSVTKST
ncbi:uncharacterized protein, partial [Bactrocera oleae]|uniref:uncharacterized protein n=1 Tax=Bactrocera oleae TaxID=104688 RepID=UPI00387EBB5B